MNATLRTVALFAALVLGASSAHAQESFRSATESLQDAPSERAAASASKVSSHLQAIQAHLAKLNQIVEDLFDEALSARHAVQTLRDGQPAIDEKIAEVSATSRKLKAEHDRFKDQINRLIGERVAQAKQMTQDKNRMVEALDNTEADQATLETTEIPALEADLKETEKEEKK